MIRTILNEKGGVAKTITAVQLAAGFAKAGKQTLLIDGDPQSCATKLLFSVYITLILMITKYLIISREIGRQKKNSMTGYVTLRIKIL